MREHRRAAHPSINLPKTAPVRGIFNAAIPASPPVHPSRAEILRKRENEGSSAAASRPAILDIRRRLSSCSIRAAA